MDNKFNVFLLIVFSLFLFSSCVIAQSLPANIEDYEYYKDYLNKLKEREMQATSLGVQVYQSPELFPDTLLEREIIRRRDMEAQVELEKEMRQKEKDCFLEPIIMNEETIQVIRKATPKKLQIFGSGIFSGEHELYYPISQTPISDDYVLGVGDRLYLYLWGNVDMEYDLVIDREGRVFIPKAGAIVIAGISIGEAEQKVKQFLEKIYSNFNLDLSLGKVKGIKVFIFGEVQWPGAYTLSGLASVLNALDIAGGPTDIGTFREIKVMRAGKVQAVFDLYDILINGNLKSNVVLTSNDVIFVPKAKKQIMLRGKVKRPAIYELKEGETFSSLIEFGGGFLPDASLDNVMIDRITQNKHTIKTYDYELVSDSTIELFDNDDISIFPVSKRRMGQVSLIGHALQPGQYELYDNMTISDLVDDGKRLLPDTYRKRADLLRKKTDLTEKIINVSLDSAIAKVDTYNLKLKNGDKLVIYSIWDILWKKYVTINGAVKKPGEYKLYEDMKVSDLVFEAGGILENTYLLEAELARVVPGEPARIFNLDFQKIFNDPGCEEDIYLQENDQLFIREIPGYKLAEIVTIAGEVNFPGKYAIQMENERLTELIDRAGGLTKNAFLKGATFLRPSIQKSVNVHDLESIILSTQEAVLDSAGNVYISPILFTYDTTKLSRIIIDLEAAMEGDTEEDVILEDEDKIYIPKIPTGVSVVGAVPSSGTITYVKGENVKYYIDKAGGFTKNADKGELRLVKANGKVVKCSSGTKDIEPGDIIVVPQTIKKEVDWGNILKDAVSVITGIATTIYIIVKL